MSDIRVRKITILLEDGTKLDLGKFDHIETKIERGLQYVGSSGHSQLIDNGQRRLVIKCWSGFDQWDEFKTEVTK